MDNSGYTPWSPQVTYDSNGYATAVNPISNTPNPWNTDKVYTQAQQAGQSINQSMGNLYDQMNTLNGGYPAMQNSFGLGAQVGPVAGAQSGQDYMTTPISQGTPDSSSRGFNPWSLTGEALSRG